MAIETGVQRSRRALLAGGLGGLAAVVASALGLPTAVEAGGDGDVVLGADNHTTQLTTVHNTGNSILSTGFVGASDNGTGVSGLTTVGKVGAVTGRNENSGTGVYGISVPTGSLAWPPVTGPTGVYGYANQNADAVGTMGESAVGTGVFGYSKTWTGVRGKSESNLGVYGSSNTGVGVHGQGVSSIGVRGLSGSGNPPASAGMIGVYGYAAQDATAVGVKGQSTGGTGVLAVATTGSALKVAGKALFSRCGRASVLARKSYVDVTVAGGLTSHSVVHATLQTHRTGVAIAAVRANYPTTGKARIYLTKVASSTASTYVGWFAAEY